MDGKRKSGDRGKRGGKGGKKSKADDGAAQKLRASLSEALAILDWSDASDADLETALEQLGPCVHQLLELSKKGRSGALDVSTQQKLLGAIETSCASPQPRVCCAAWKALRELSLLEAELCALAIERGLTALALLQLRGPPGAAPTELRLCALGVLWNLSEACPEALHCFGAPPT